MELKKGVSRRAHSRPRKEKAKTPGVEKIPGIDREADDIPVFVGDVELKVMDVPGHTLGTARITCVGKRAAFIGDSCSRGMRTRIRR